MVSIFAFTSMLFSMLAMVSYSLEVKLVLFGMSGALLCAAIAFFIAKLIEEDTTTHIINIKDNGSSRVETWRPKPDEVKIPLRDSSGRYIKGHTQTNFKK